MQVSVFFLLFFQNFYHPISHERSRRIVKNWLTGLGIVRGVYRGKRLVGVTVLPLIELLLLTRPGNRYSKPAPSKTTGVHSNGESLPPLHRLSRTALMTNNSRRTKIGGGVGGFFERGIEIN